MKKTLTTFVAFGVAASCGILNAQPPGGPSGPGGFIRMMPITAALDADGDGEISMAEIEMSASVLKKLDKDENGKLTADEIRPAFGGRRGPSGFGLGREGREGSRRGAGGPGEFGRDRGFGRPGGPPKFGRRGRNPEEFVKRALEFDADNNGQLSKAELGKMAVQFGRGGFGGPERRRSERPARPE